MNPWTASLAILENLIIPTTALGDEPVSSTPSDQIGGERPCILTVTTSIGRLNLEATAVTPGDTMITSVGRITFGNPAWQLLCQDSPRKVANKALPQMRQLKGTWPKSNHEMLPTIEDMMAFGQKDMPMTTFGQKDCDAIWWEQSHVLL